MSRQLSLHRTTNTPTFTPISDSMPERCVPVRVIADNRVTIPADVVDDLDIEAGDRVFITIETVDDDKTLYSHAEAVASLKQTGQGSDSKP